MSDAPAPVLATPAGSAHARILGVGAYRPDRVVTNEEVCTWIDSSDAWIRERTGIESRRFAAPDETVVDMAAAAAGKAIAAAGVAPAQVGAVIVATITHLRQTPSAASLLADRLGLAPGVASFDLSAACAGFCYGVAAASDMVRAGSASYVLVVGVEKLTDIVDRHDRGSSFIFADGAGAVVIGPSDTAGIAPVVWGTDGAQAEAIAQEYAWSSLRGGAPADEPYPFLRMQGQPVFRWAVTTVPEVAHRALAAAGVRAEELGAFIPHQANNRITDAVVKRLGLGPGVRVCRDIVTSGNTSAASIPLGMAAMLESGEVRSGDLALLVGFGAGLTYAAQVVVLP